MLRIKMDAENGQWLSPTISLQNVVRSVLLNFMECALDLKKNLLRNVVGISFWDDFSMSEHFITVLVCYTIS